MISRRNNHNTEMDDVSLRLSSFLCCLLIIAIFLSQAIADDVSPVTRQDFHYFCNDKNDQGNYTTNSTYDKNLNTVLSTLISNTEINYGFYNFSYGENDSRVYAIGLCRGDIKPDECRSCLASSRANLTEICPNRKEAIGWYSLEICMLRYAPRNIFSLMEDGPPTYYAHNEENATDLEEFNQLVRNLLNGLKSEAASGDTKFKYATGNDSLSNFQRVYGLVQCTPDLSGTECDDCLSLSIARIPIDCCKDKIGGRVVRPSCNMRFETGSPFYGPPAYAPPPPPPPGGNNNWKKIVIAIAVSVAVVMLGFIIYFRVRKPRKISLKEAQEVDDEEIKLVESLQYNFDTLRDATDDFSDSNKLGQGGFGAVYKGTLTNGQEIAVKRLAQNSDQGDSEFKNEVLLLAKLQHRNLVRLLGFCLEGRERLLIYEFASNKSLDYFLFDPTRRPRLNWERRYNIIGGIVRGLVYLHEDSQLRIIHRDLKASNILLDEEMNAKIADFGMARLFVVDQTHSNTERVAGTYGYMAPEYIMYGQFSMKSDVFSFGVLVLEIISGMKITSPVHGENEVSLLSFVWRNWREGTITNVIDPTLNNGSQNEILRCIHIGLLCVQADVTVRPTMATILLMLNSSSFTLRVPSEPAFFQNSGVGNLSVIQSWEYNSEATRSGSVNGASINDPYPR